uniref:hypothetical protein n=1 Tax=Serratia proteamaculans TaxID=28151 RepID=UPI001F4C46FC|nr:hypothetical protein [Serratia proteamaculans]
MNKIMLAVVVALGMTSAAHAAVSDQSHGKCFFMSGKTKSMAVIKTTTLTSYLWFFSLEPVIYIVLPCSSL